MSVDITIKEQGVAQDIDDATKISTRRAGSGTDKWLPESDVTTAPLRVTKNGTYDAADASVYGYNQIEVDVQNAESVSGKINGVDYVITVDANGYLVYTPVE